MYTGSFGATKSYALPNRTFCSLSNEVSWTCNAIQDDNIAGFELGLTDVRGLGVKLVSLSLPEGDQLVTYFFRTSHPLGWLGLEVGASSSSPTTDNKYRITLARRAATIWKLALISADPHGLTSQLQLTTDTAAPPFKRVTLEFSGGEGSQHFRGKLQASRS